MSLVSISGFIALITYIVTLIPTNLNTLFPGSRKNSIVKILSHSRRNTGLTSFFFASLHAAITISHLNINLMDKSTYSIYYTGIFSLIVFTLLAITSNDFSIRKLKKAWKILHNLTYVAMILLLVHIWSLMLGKWTGLTGIGLCLLSLMTIISFIRLYLGLWKKSFSNMTV